MADQPPPTIEQLLAQMTAALAAVQQRADQSDQALAALRALVQERMPRDEENGRDYQYEEMENEMAAALQREAERGLLLFNERQKYWLQLRG